MSEDSAFQSEEQKLQKDLQQSKNNNCHHGINLDGLDTLQIEDRCLAYQFDGNEAVSQSYGPQLKNKQNSKEFSILEEANDQDKTKMRLSQIDAKEENSTPNTPFHLFFASEEQQKINQEKFEAIDKIDKQLNNYLEDFSPIAKMEDSRADLTAQAFDLSMVQSKDLIQSQRIFSLGGTQKALPSKSSFSNQIQLLQRNDSQSTKNAKQSSIILQMPPSSTNQPSSMTRLGASSKQEQKTQKLRQRLEKYSHQMMSNIQLQNNQIEGAIKNNQTKNMLQLFNKNVSQKLSEKKTIQAQQSLQNNKFSSPISKKDNKSEIKLDDLVQQKERKEKSCNQANSQIPKKKNDQSKTERNTPNNQNKQTVLINGNNNVKSTNHQISQSIQDQKFSHNLLSKSIPQNLKSIGKIQAFQNLNLQKFLLNSPSKQKYQANLKQKQSPQVIEQDTKQISSQQHQNIVFDFNNFQKETYLNHSPSNRVKTDTEVLKRKSMLEYVSNENVNKRKYSDNRLQKGKSFSQGNFDSDQIPQNEQNWDNFNSNNNKMQINEYDDKLISEDYFQNQQSQGSEFQAFHNKQISNFQEQIDNDEAYTINIYKRQSNQIKQSITEPPFDNEKEQQVQFSKQLQGENHDNKEQIVDSNANQENQKDMPSQYQSRKSYTEENLNKNDYQSYAQIEGGMEEQLIEKYNLQSYTNLHDQDKIEFSKEVLSENSFVQEENKYFTNIKVDQNKKDQNSSKVASLYHINNFQLSSESNFTAYTNAISTTTQGHKAISSAKYIDQDEDEVIDSRIQSHNNHLLEEKQQEQKNQIFIENQINMKDENQSSQKIFIPQKNEIIWLQSQSKTHNNKIEQKTNQKCIQTNDAEKTQTYRFSDQIDIRKKSERNLKNTNNNNNSGLSNNTPICLYNLNKESSHKSTKNTSKKVQNLTLNQNYFSVYEEASENNSKKMNQTSYNQIKHLSNQNSPNKPSQNQIFIEKNYKQQQSTDQYAQTDSKSLSKTTVNLTQFEKQAPNSKNQQSLKCQQTQMNDKQGSYAQLQLNSHSNLHHILDKQSVQSLPTTPQNACSSPYQQNSQYSQLFQQKQANKTSSFRDQAHKKEKFIRTSNDFGSQQSINLTQKQKSDEINTKSNHQSENQLVTLNTDQTKNQIKQKPQQLCKTLSVIYEPNTDSVGQKQPKENIEKRLSQRNQKDSEVQLTKNSSSLIQVSKISQKQSTAESQQTSSLNSLIPSVRESFSKQHQIMLEKQQKSPSSLKLKQQPISKTDRDYIKNSEKESIKANSSKHSSQKHIQLSQQSIKFQPELTQQNQHQQKAQLQSKTAQNFKSKTYQSMVERYGQEQQLIREILLHQTKCS